MKFVKDLSAFSLTPWILFMERSYMDQIYPGYLFHCGFLGFCWRVHK